MTNEEFSAAYKNGYSLTVSFLRSRGVPEKEALDFAQDGWFRGWRKISLLREPRYILTWINRISLNLYLKQLARRTDALYHAFEALDHGSMTVEDNGSKIERYIDLSRILRKCSKYHRRLIIMQLYGWMPQEVAEKEKINASALRIRFWRARIAAQEVKRKIESGELR